ncbi:hypothetical protein ACFPIJ_29480 [Dactylosporangium cerinum]|uniref:Uncharacterized protein n=1 Tax=Dactylosporangium cerinum TaxID=1434730 RepID=A0ABV9W3L5_9ACTN
MSLQAKKTARAAFDAALAAKLAAFDFVIDSQVTLSVRQWAVPRRRWESDVEPDLDNWLKPLIDSFVGADRLLVDDSLIRSVEVSWGEGSVSQSVLQVRLDFDTDHRLMKNGLRYIQFPGGLCFPLPGDVTGEAAAIWLNVAESTLDTVRSLNAVADSGWLLLTNGWIHRARLGQSFTVVSAADLKVEVGLPRMHQNPDQSQSSWSASAEGQRLRRTS